MNTNNFIVTTTEHIENATIKCYLDAICTNIVIGTNVFSDFAASLSDFFGGKSDSYKRKLEYAYNEARRELEQKARKMGANAILGFKVDFDEVSGKDKSMFMISASGTACIIDYQEQRAQQNNAAKSISQSDYDREIQKKEIISKLESGKFQQSWITFLFEEHPKEAVKPLISLYQNSYGEDETLKQIVSIIKSYPREYVVNEIYSFLEDSNWNGSICTLIRECDLFDAKKVLEVCRKNIHTAIKLLSAGRDYYDEKEIESMKSISLFLDNLPDTGKIEKLKTGIISKKEEEFFICENGHKSPASSEFCDNYNCGVNIKGLTQHEISAINQFKNKIEILSRML